MNFFQLVIKVLRKKGSLRDELVIERRGSSKILASIHKERMFVLKSQDLFLMMTAAECCLGSNTKTNIFNCNNSNNINNLRRFGLDFYE